MVALVVSVLLHVVPLPLYFVLSLVPWFGQTAAPLEDHATIIPIDLMMAEGETVPGTDPLMPAPTITTLEEITGTSSNTIDTQKAETPPNDQPDAGDQTDADQQATDAAHEDTGSEDSADDAADDTLNDSANDTANDAAIEATDDASGMVALHGDAEGDDAQRDASASAVSGEDAATDAPWIDLDAAIARADVRTTPSTPAPPSSASTAIGLTEGKPATDAGVIGRDGATGDARVFTPIRDPIGISGDAKNIVPRKPNLSLLLFPERFRSHPLTVQFSPLLTALQNWQNFFGGTNLDPIRDTDQILLAGPQFRDTSRVVAVVLYNVSEAQVRNSIDTIVKRSGSSGKWEGKTPPVARAHVDGAERYFVMTGPKMLVVVPPDGLDQALKHSKTMDFSDKGKGNESLVLDVMRPANAFRGLPVKLPTSVTSMRFSLSLNPKGGADCRLDAKDASAEAAQTNAAALTETINKAMVLDLVFTKRRIIDPVTFRAEGDHIRTELHITDKQLHHILNMTAAQIERLQKPKRPPTPSPPSGVP